MTQNQIAYWNLQETMRTNRAKEDIQTNTLEETKRSNIARETETNRSNIAKETETNRSNIAKETETHRNNKVMEGVAIANAVTSGLEKVTKAGKNVSDTVADWIKPTNWFKTPNYSGGKGNQNATPTK